MITVLLASCNGAPYIGQQLDSLLSQTWQDFSIAISDDHSLDGTKAILDQYALAHPGKIRLLCHDKPSGSAKDNFFRLLSEVSDQYLMLCDQDDVWLPSKVEKTWARMEEMERRYGKDMPVLVHGDLKVVDQDLKLVCPSMAVGQRMAPDRCSLSGCLVENRVTGSTVMINQALRQRLSRFPGDCCMHDWWLALVASCFGKISYIQQPLALYRQHGGNQLGARDPASLGQLGGRLGPGGRESARENYGKMFRQAEEFLEIYRKELTGNQVEVLEHFILIPRLGRLEKIKTMVKYRFFKSRAWMTLGQMLFIP